MRVIVALVVALSTLLGCASKQGAETRTTERDRTKKGAAIGAASGAVLGEGELDEILAGAAIGAGIGAGVGAYMDAQQEKLARIPGTTVEHVGEDMLLIHFDSDVLFDVDSAILGIEALARVDEAAEVFNEYYVSTRLLHRVEEAA
jgi:outer membrane protein OmpA-like peptidoglycan-associated protein